MDTLGSLALATEPPTEKLLYRKPHDRNEYIISKKMFKFILGTAMIQVAVVLIIVFSGDTFLPEYKDAYDFSLFAGGNIRYKYSDHGCALTVPEIIARGGTPISGIKNFDKDKGCEAINCICENDTCYNFVCNCDYETTCTLIASGRMLTVSGKEDYRVFWEAKHEGSRHVFVI